MRSSFVRKLNYLKFLVKKPLKINDDYLNWLRFANAGMLERGNLYCFDYAFKNLPTNSPVFEIGSFCGLSTNIMSYLLKKYNKNNKIITSDKWQFEVDDKNKNTLGESNMTLEEYQIFVKETFIRNVNFFSKDNIPFPIEVYSDEFFELWDKEETVKDIFGREIKLGGKMSFAFIDGNHTYEFAKRDFENVAKHLDIGGFVFFDDSSDFSYFGCADVMKDILNNPDFNLVIKNPNYLFQKIK
ncbi:MAG: class I SAM-dependent methyltransferase [Bacteroidales bacterium]|nr:class I SAM-dependent methyltransferase [Bacteroidales bacterium]